MIMINVNNIKSPLVSIIVITYNSSKFVLETLESAKAQTYQNIELIVSDDNSTDETVDICKKWIDENKQRFVRAIFVSSDSNTGIPANINRGFNISKGLWIKGIAGDDLLAEDCITELIHYISTQQEDIRILSSDMIRFSGNSINNGEIVKNPNTWFCSSESSAKDQYKMLLRSNRIFAATVIIRRDLLLSFNGYDERFRLLEDWPLWVKITSSGYKIFHINKSFIYYRIHENNLSRTANKSYIYHPVNKIDVSFREKEILHRLPFIERFGLRHKIIGMKICFFLGNDRKNPITRFIYFVFIYTNPFSLYLRLLNVTGINYCNNKYL